MRPILMYAEPIWATNLQTNNWLKLEWFQSKILKTITGQGNFISNITMCNSTKSTTNTKQDPPLISISLIKSTSLGQRKTYKGRQISNLFLTRKFIGFSENLGTQDHLSTDDDKFRDFFG